MGFMTDLLKSRGKVGAIALIVLGGYMLAENFMNAEAPTGTMAEGMMALTTGLSLFGIRAKQK